MSNVKNRMLKLTSIVACKYFKQGVAEYHAGRWSEIPGSWYRFNAMEMYEKGRLVACVTGATARNVGVKDYRKAIEAGAIPRATIQ